MLVVIGNIISVFGIVLIGFGSCKLRVLPMEATGHLSKLLLTFAAPCLVIHTMTQTEFSLQMWDSIKQALIGGNLYYIVYTLLAIPLVALIRAPKADACIYRLMMTFTNNGYLGFGITYAIFGETGLFYMVIVNIFTAIYVYTLGILQMNLAADSSDQRRTAKQVLRAMVTPSTVAPLVGMFLFFLSIPVPGIISNLLESMGSMTTPLSMFIIGMQLGKSSLWQMLTNIHIGLMTVLRLILFPAATFLVSVMVVSEPLVVCVLTLTAAMPCATIPVVLAEDYGKNAKLAAELVAVTTFFSMFTLPIVSLALTYYINTI